MSSGKSQAFLVLWLVLSTGVRAAEFDNGIPLDLAKALIEVPHTGEVRFYDEPPPAFPEVTVPSHFSFVGGMEMAEAGLVRIVLKSQHSLSEGLELLTASLQEDGYVLVPKMPARQRGFISDASETMIQNLCNDDKGALTIRALSRGGPDVFYSISGSRTTVDASGNTCGDRVRRRNEFVDSMNQRRNSGIRAELPIMSMPLEEGSASTGVIVGTRSSGGDDYYEISSQLKSGQSASHIHNHITDQLIDQGWEQVQELSEQESNWRTTVESRLVFGELVIRKVDEETLNLYFRISNNDGLIIEESRLRYSPRRI
ncbi:MAG: hypothetical protein MI746_03020 [Pseudomonadales bacterium]|nr:hypothetical protein [Pseudomonadales bacterium]